MTFACTGVISNRDGENVNTSHSENPTVDMRLMAAFESIGICLKNIKWETQPQCTDKPSPFQPVFCRIKDIAAHFGRPEIKSEPPDKLEEEAEVKTESPPTVVSGML